ncbi:MAG: hypothetical protein HY460_01400, partial [Parcubacteria group bacterium]|nr:hypothetical protein [Parcubacteria group bacterium]
MRIVVTAGGTGGHELPTIAVIQTLQSFFSPKKMSRGAESSGRSGSEEPSGSRRRTPLELGIIAIGPATFGLPYYHAYGVPVRNIITGKYHRHAPWTIPLHAVKGVFGLVQSLFLLWWHMPDVIFSKGGYG